MWFLVGEPFRTAAFRWLLLLLALAVLWLWAVEPARLAGRAYATPEAPWGIVSLELAVSATDADAIVRSWDRQGLRDRAIRDTWLDYLFVLLYATFLGLGCLLTANLLRAQGWPGGLLGTPLARGIVLAGALDIVENVALLVMLGGAVSDFWAALARVCAIPKFVLIAAGAAYTLLGGAVWIRSWWRRDPAMPPSTALCVCEALEAECATLHAGPNPGCPGSRPTHEHERVACNLEHPASHREHLGRIYGHIHGLKSKRTALCLSGGGVRSATFNLGVLQGLAWHGLLDQFDYLSTVSGGGYTGGWLSAWIHGEDCEDERDRSGRSGLRRVIDKLNARPRSQLTPEPETLSHLREYSNYLTPKLGLLSADTWTVVATYVRNLTLNWLVLVPLLLAMLAIPRLWVSLVSLTPPREWILWLLGGTLLVAEVLAMQAIIYLGRNLPWDAHSQEHGRRVWTRSLLWWLGAAVLFITAWALYRNAVAAQRMTMLPGGLILVIFSLVGASLSAVGWFEYRRRRSRGQAESAGGPRPPSAQPDHTHDGRRLSLVLILATTPLGAVAIWGISRLPIGAPADNPLLPSLYVWLAVPLFISLFLLALAVLLGLSSSVVTEPDLEWWARFGGSLFIANVAWIVLSGLVLFGPDALSWVPGIAASLGVTVSGLITLVLGSSAKTRATDDKGVPPSKRTTALDYLVKLAAPTFAALLVVLLSLGTSTAIAGLQAWSPETTSTCGPPDFVPEDPFRHVETMYCSPFRLVLALAGLAFLIGLVMSYSVDVNKFSLHSMYRNRLIRTYLGAARAKARRRPNLFTRFDPDDDVSMARLWPGTTTGSRRHKLLHVVNIALNLVGGDRLAWQERKAEPFTITPLHAGNYDVGYRKLEEGADDRKRYYGGRPGVSLGTAVTISGAAASPNMGYNSSPIVSLLMTLFNVRLGWWLGNPRREEFDDAYPAPWVKPLIAEAAGRTDNTSPYVYLSDGGHFENFGLYEMILRRCHLIVVIDATTDPSYRFDSLSSSVRQIRIDLGIPIEFPDGIRIHHKDSVRAQEGKYCAVGTIRYSCVDGKDTDGRLIYVKPTLVGNEPSDVAQYSRASPAFPQEPLGDQFYGESQFESYRMLGWHVVKTICGHGPNAFRPRRGQAWSPVEPWGQFAADRFAERVEEYLAAPAEAPKPGLEPAPPSVRAAEPSRGRARRPSKGFRATLARILG
ncbi:MAG: patatin-like phospholipase family protein [Chloroflexi bacterium]|nr:patatin-like phospholipase family protein [Chloroflexota bacterium]